MITLKAKTTKAFLRNHLQIRPFIALLKIRPCCEWVNWDSCENKCERLAKCCGLAAAELTTVLCITEIYLSVKLDNLLLHLFSTFIKGK